MSETERVEFNIIENLQRSDLKPMELARAFDEYCRITNQTSREAAVRLHKNETTITRARRLLKLDPSLQRQIEKGKLTAKHGREVARIEDYATQIEVVAKVHRERLNTSQTEELVKQMLGDKRKPSSRKKRKARGLRRIPFGDPTDKVTVFAVPKPGATYDDVEEALAQATSEARHRIKNRVSLD